MTRGPIPGLNRAWFDRLMAALADVEENPDEDWGASWNLGHLRYRIVEADMLTMRLIGLRAAMLARIDAAGDALSLGHVLKRFYTQFRTIVTPLRTPFLEHIKKKSSAGPSVRWGGSHMYFDMMTTPPYSTQATLRSRFWRDPFVGAS